MSPAPSPRALKLIQTLVQINTVSQRSNLALIDFAQSELAKLGVASRLTFNADKTKANLFTTLGADKSAASSSRATPTPCTDTVPWDGQDWTLEPLSATVENGRLYGQGSCEMNFATCPAPTPSCSRKSSPMPARCRPACGTSRRPVSLFKRSAKCPLFWARPAMPCPLARRLAGEDATTAIA